MRTVKAIAVSETVNIILDKFPDECGICHKNIAPNFLSAIFVDGTRASSKLEATFHCTNRECSSLIIGYYNRGENGYFYFARIAPIVPKSKDFDPEIKEVSPSFVDIYNQSLFAEQTSLTLISGIGYRKALEFLVKDFLVYLDEGNKEAILKMQLGQCINKLQNHNIKEITKRATWLGNDEAHYTRIWIEKDVSDLKKLIGVACHFITMDITTKKYIEEMSK